MKETRSSLTYLWEDVKETGSQEDPTFLTYLWEYIYEGGR